MKNTFCQLNLWSCGTGASSVNRLSAKVVLPTTSSIKALQWKNELHTSSPAKQEMFVLPKDRKQGAQHWYTERIVAVGLIGLVPLGILYPMQMVDQSLAVLIPLHSYWGVNAILSDYLWRPALPVAKASWLLLSVITAAGLMYLNVHDVGICKLLIMLMKV